MSTRAPLDPCDRPAYRRHPAPHLRSLLGRLEDELAAEYAHMRTLDLLAEDEVLAWRLAEADVFGAEPEHRILLVGWQRDRAFVKRELAIRRRAAASPLAPPFPASRPTYDLDEIKRRLRIEALLERHGATLKPCAGRLWTNCPLPPEHDRGRPSLGVDPGKQLWYCHACKSGGDVIRLAQLLTNVSFTEALDACAAVAGVDPVPADPGPRLRTPHLAPARKVPQLRVREVRRA